MKRSFVRARSRRRGTGQRFISPQRTTFAADTVLHSRMVGLDQRSQDEAVTARTRMLLVNLRGRLRPS